MIPVHEDVVAGRTLAEIQGMTAELGAAIAGLAAAEAREGRLQDARDILEGLLVTNPRDALAWALLSQVERLRGSDGSAYLCAEAAARLAPDDVQVRLARAEAHLAVPRRRDEGVGALRALQAEGGPVGERARALLRALGE
jgi:predicted Zn-dependent protease